MQRESFFDDIFYTFDKWRKRVQEKYQRNINALRWWSASASKVDGEQSPLNSFL